MRAIAGGGAPSKKNVRRKRVSGGQGHPTGVFAQAGLEPPIHRLRREQHERAVRAQERAPARPAPAIPRLEHPTRRQVQAAKDLSRRSLQRQVPKGQPAGERVAQIRQVQRELNTDPRTRGSVQTLRHYLHAEERRAALTTADKLGVKGSRAQRLAAGRALLAATHPRAHAGRAPTRLSAGVGPSVNLTALGRTVMGATSLGADSAENRWVKNAAGDVKALATGPFVGAYEAGAAGVDLAKGHPERAGRLAKGVASGIAGSVPARLLRGDLKGAAEQFKAHPLMAALDVSAAEAVVGRGLGAVARGAGSTVDDVGMRGALARSGSTVRPPLGLGDDVSAGIVSRTHSKDAFRKAAQVERDAAREPLRRPDGSIVRVMDRGREVPVLKARPAEIARHQKKSADFDASRANQVERLVRDRADREMKVRGVRGQRAKDLVSMVVEGTITTGTHFERDLRAHADRLKQRIQDHESRTRVRRGRPPVFRHAGELEAARARVALAEKALADPRVLRQKDKIVRAGEEIGRKLNEGEREAIRLGALDPKRAARSRLVPAAVEHLGARHFTSDELEAAKKGGVTVSDEALKHGAIRHADGRFLGNADVEQALRDRGRDPDTVAYLPHRLDVRGRRAFHSQFRPGTRPMLDKAEGRTGEAYRKGATESSEALIREHGVRQQVQIAKARQIDRSIGDQGARRPDGRYFTAKEAMEAADRVYQDTGRRLVPVRAFASRLSPHVQKTIRDDMQGPGGMDSLAQRLLDDRVVHAPDEPGRPRARNVVLMDGEYMDRLNQHLRPAGSMQKLFQMVNRPFRFTVLAQPRWLAGQFVEPYLVRLPGVGSGVNVFGLGVDIAAANKLLKTMRRSGDPRMRAAAEELEAQQLGGLLIGGRGASVRRSADEIPAYGRLVQRLPVVGQAADLVRLAGRAVMAPAGAFFRANRVIEGLAQRAALGKDVRRDMQQFTGSWTKTLTLQQKAIEDVAKGLTDTPTQRRFMRSQHELLGKYEGFPPWMREMTQTLTPFLPWALNAARFVFWTMPAHRTVQTALLMKVNDVVAKDWDDQHKDVPPGGLKLAVPTKDGGWIDLARYTPYGLTGPIVNGELGEITDQFAPQLSGTVSAIEGRDPFGRDLQVRPTADNPTGEASGGQRAKIAANQFLESLVPYVGQARRMLEHGETGYADSTIVHPKGKPGTSHGMSGFERAWSPLRPTYLKKSGGGSVPASGGSGGFSGPQMRALDRAAHRESVGGLSEAQLRALTRAAH